MSSNTDTCANCKEPLNPNIASWASVCKPCYVVKMQKLRFNKCIVCEKFNCIKTKDYTTCYTCNMVNKEKKKKSPLMAYAFSTK
jgi:hypothetical protein